MGRNWIGLSLMGLALLAGHGLAQGNKPVTAQPVSKPMTQPKPAATVNGEVISLQDVEDVLKMAPPPATPLNETQKKAMRIDALSMLIDDLLMRQFLAKNAPKVDPAEVDKQFASLDAAVKKQGKSLADYYKESGQTEKQVRANILTMLQWQEYVKARKISEDELKKYFEEYKDYFENTTIRVSHIVVRLAANATPGQKQAAQQKLQNLRAEIVAGKLDFAEAAKKTSQCPSAPQGGDLGYIPRKFMVDDGFARAAFALKVGGVSEIFQTEFGLHLVKVTDRKEGEKTEFAKIQDKVRDCFVEELRLGLLAEERKKAQITDHLQ